MDPELLFKGLVSARLLAEFESYSFVNDPDVFQRVRCVDGAVCSLRETERIICL